MTRGILLHAPADALGDLRADAFDGTEFFGARGHRALDRAEAFQQPLRAFGPDSRQTLQHVELPGPVSLRPVAGAAERTVDSQSPTIIWYASSGLVLPFTNARMRQYRPPYSPLHKLISVRSAP